VLSESDQDFPDYHYLKHIREANELANIGSFVSFPTAPNDGPSSKIIPFLFPTLLFLFRSLLVLGMAASVIGYVGCFSLIQASNNKRDPLIWLGTEVVLCFVRLIIWASNPGWDDPPPPIALRKVRSKQDSEVAGDNSVIYDVSWTLDDITADDMHALVIGIDEVKSGDVGKLTGAVADAEKIVIYLKDDLGVPEQQITLLTNAVATASGITDALGAFATNNNIRRGAPILIYIASSSDKVEPLTNHASHDGTYPSNPGPWPLSEPFQGADVKLITYDFDRRKHTGLSYAKILDLLQVIAMSKGENIVSHRGFPGILEGFWI